MSEPEPSSPPAPVDPPQGGDGRWKWVVIAALVLALGFALKAARRGEEAAAPTPAAATPPTVPPEPVPPTPVITPPAAETPTFSLGPIMATDLADAAAAKKFTLLVPIIAGAGSKVAVRDLVIEVRFYDQVAGGAIVPTRAQVRSKWSEPPADWNDGEAETLEVEYALAKATALEETREERQFHGYLVRVYYQDRLQAVEALPAELRERFPTPAVRSADEQP